jgi:hypothetical protein
MLLHVAAGVFYFRCRLIKQFDDEPVLRGKGCFRAI